MIESTGRKPLEHYLDLDYPFEIHPDPGGGYVIVHPDLPGCVSQTKALEDAPALAKDARTGWLMTEYDEGRTIPEPSR